MTRNFSTPNHPIISKTGKTQFVLSIGFIRLSSDWWAQCFIQIFKKTKNQHGRSIMPHRDARGFFINITLKMFFDSANKFHLFMPNFGHGIDLRQSPHETKYFWSNNIWGSTPKPFTDSESLLNRSLPLNLYFASVFNIEI